MGDFVDTRGPYAARFSAAGDWLNPTPEAEDKFNWGKFDAEDTVDVTRKQIEVELDLIEANRVASARLADGAQQAISERKPWPLGELTNEPRQRAGTCFAPNLANGQQRLAEEERTWTLWVEIFASGHKF